MINDIRFQASNLLQLSDNTPVLNGTFNSQQAYENTFEELLENNNNINEANSSASFMPLGIPAGFNIDFSLLEEMEKQN